MNEIGANDRRSSLVGPSAREMATRLHIAADRLGVPVDARLQLAQVEPRALVDVPAPSMPAVAAQFGVARQWLHTESDRRRAGAWFTPQKLADDLVGRAVQRAHDTVLDACCGGGSFLVAAADRLVELGASPTDVVVQLRGVDIDPLSVAVAEAALWLWAAEHDVADSALAAVSVGDPLVDPPVEPVDAVVGNPPFLGQLRADTTTTDVRRRALQDRWGDVVRPYTDAAWLFLLHAVESVRAGGRVVLIQPQSLLAARDAAGVRESIDRLGSMVDCWIGEGGEFDASVDVCAPVIVRTVSTDLASRAGPPTSPKRWTDPLATALGVPEVDVAADGQVSDVATVLAGFRDEYYGLRGAVVEDGDGPRLVTAGAIDPLVLRSVPVRFAKQSFARPTIDVERVSGRAARWVASQATPKLLVASQTNVLEVVVDHHGDLVGSVPVMPVVPHTASVESCWRLAAVLCSPVVSAMVVRSTVGTALTAGACKPTAAVLGAMPLPRHDEPWARAVRLLTDWDDTGRVHGSPSPDWPAFAALMNAAYGVVDDTVTRWWLGRLPRRGR